MIVVGLAIEAVAAALVVLGLLGPASSATAIWWSSIAAVLVGLLTVSIGLRRARPSRGGWTPPRTLVDDT